jgi:prepilin-type processing-associated H-X9-DG protein
LKPSLSSHWARGLTLIEIFVILAVIAALAALLFPTLIKDKVRAQRINCVSCLKQIGLSTRVWDGDHTGLYPMQVSSTNGGTMEFITGTNAWRHLQVMSNELSTPYILICAAESDRMRTRATNFDFLSNSNLSYFVGLDANETNPQLILTGDRNITNGASVKNGVLDLTTNTAAGWTAELHNGVGNIGLADGSVRQLSMTGLRDTVENTGLATNRLQMPILSP